jgi:hypothetical protein
MRKGFIPIETQKKEIPIKDHARKTLILKSRGYATEKGKPKKIKKPFEIGRVVWGQQSGTKTDPKIIIIEEILWKDRSKRKELRFGYYVLTSEKAKKHKGIWWWGQSALMVPIGDIQELLKLAEEKGLLTT